MEKELTNANFTQFNSHPKIRKCTRGSYGLHRNKLDGGGGSGSFLELNDTISRTKYDRALSSLSGCH